LDAVGSVVRPQEKVTRDKMLEPEIVLDQKCEILSKSFLSYEDTE
jgi:hypothetical protein